jgi:hypothetical protein
MAVLLLACGALVVAVALPALSALVCGKRLRSWSAHLTILQTLLAVTAALLAGVWYFFERPNDAKLKFDQAVDGFPAGNGRVLIVAEVSITNIGSTLVRLKDAPLSLYVQQVTPLPRGVEAEYQPTVPAGVARQVRAADNWALLAAAGPAGGRGAPVTPVNSVLEAGETENLYYRVILPCRPGLRVYVTARFHKPQSGYDRLRGRKLAWIKQSLLDLTGACGGEAHAP